MRLFSKVDEHFGASICFGSISNFIVIKSQPFSNCILVAATDGISLCRRKILRSVNDTQGSFCLKRNSVADFAKEFDYFGSTQGT